MLPAEASLDGPFQAVLDGTSCPFARRGTWWHVVDARLQILLGCLRTAAAASPDECDGVIAQVSRVPALGVAAATLETLKWLGAHGQPQVEVTAMDLRNPAWWFVLDGNRFFVLAFTDALGRSHPRCSAARGTYLVFQRESAFRRRFPGGIPSEVRASVRAAFARGHQPYAQEGGVLSLGM